MKDNSDENKDSTDSEVDLSNKTDQVMKQGNAEQSIDKDMSTSSDKYMSTS